MGTHTQGCDRLLVVTDRKSLAKLLGDRTLDEITSLRLFRLKQRTLLWKFEIEYLPGKDNHAENAASRYPSTLDPITIDSQFNDFENSITASIGREIENFMAVT